MLTSYERKRIGGKKKVNALKDGLLILIEIVKYFLKIKNKYLRFNEKVALIFGITVKTGSYLAELLLKKLCCALKEILFNKYRKN